MNSYSSIIGRQLPASPTIMEKSAQEAPTCASLLQVLANETRLAVVEQLLSGPKHVGEINETLGVEQSLLSHHLRVLRDNGLVTAQREGKQVFYALEASFHKRQQARGIDLGCCSLSFD